MIDRPRKHKHRVSWVKEASISENKKAAFSLPLTSFWCGFLQDVRNFNVQTRLLIGLRQKFCFMTCSDFSNYILKKNCWQFIFFDNFNCHKNKISPSFFRHCLKTLQKLLIKASTLQKKCKHRKHSEPLLKILSDLFDFLEFLLKFM